MLNFWLRHSTLLLNDVTTLNFRALIRKMLGPWRIDVVSKYKLDAYSEILRDFQALIRLPHGYFQVGGEGDGTFWASHDAGLFSCLTTIMWSMIELTRLGHKCYLINNAFGMHSFKQHSYSSTYHDLFEKRCRSEIDAIFNCRPNKLQVFDHHSDYHEIIESHLGREWIEKFLAAYMSPSSNVLATAQLFVNKYRLSSVPTIFVCYRGTDKYTEIRPAPIFEYFQAVDKLIARRPGAEILIQTDQLQVRRLFMQKYGRICKYINEIPVTSGQVAMHKEKRLCGNREAFAVNLYAMCLAASRCDALVTHTGNVGFFLAMHSLLAGREVIQLK